MIPSVFVSSTIEDLRYLREEIRKALYELAYHPVMSECGDVGYLPSESVQESCYIAVRECQLAIVILGKRYGSLTDNGLSVTQIEFRTAREQQLAIICLVEEEVLSHKKVFEANKTKKHLAVPGMDDPKRTFDFIQEIKDSPVNNGVLPFKTISDAQDNLKKQLAHTFGDLLRRRRTSLISPTIKDRTDNDTTSQLPVHATIPDSFIDRLKEELEKRRRMFLVVALEGAREVIIAKDELYIEYAPEAKHLRDNLAKPDNIKVLREICRELLGRDITVRVSVREQGTSDDEKRKLREIAEAHPLVQQVLRTFHGEVVDVRRVEEE